MFPPAQMDLDADGKVIIDQDYLAALEATLSRIAAGTSGSSKRICRALVLAEPPDVGSGEITAKGSLNSAVITKRRSHLVDQLFDDAAHGVIRI